MEYHLSCDTCDFDRRVAETGQPYTLAKEHESEFDNHFVQMETINH